MRFLLSSSLLLVGLSVIRGEWEAGEYQDTTQSTTTTSSNPSNGTWNKQGNWSATHPWTKPACPLPSTSRTLTSGLTMREVVNPEAQTLTVEMTYQGEAWLGFGFSNNGGVMIGSQAVIGKPDEGTVEEYNLNDESANAIIPWTTQTLTNTSIHQANGVTVLRFTKPLVDPSNPNAVEVLADGPNTFLYAVGSSNYFSLHRLYDSFTIPAALQQCEPTLGTTGNYSTDGSATVAPSGESEESMSETTKQRLWIAHGVLMSVSWGILAPIAIACSVLRDALPKGGMWFTMHKSINTLVFLTTTVGFAIAVYLLQKEGDAPFSGGRHDLLGLIIFLMLFIQVCGGYFRPHVHPHPGDKHVTATDDEEATGAAEEQAPADDEHHLPNKTKQRVAFEIGHRLLGTTLLGLSWYQVYLGIDLYENDWGYQVGFNAVGVFFGIAGTIVGLTFLGKVGLVATAAKR